MVDAVEAIPVTGIFLTDAFSRLFRAMTPHWRDLQARLSDPGSRENWDDHDHAERRANEAMREAFTDGSLTPLIYSHGMPEKLPREGWELRGQFETGIASNFVSPDDPINPGPRTDRDGQRHAVFIDRVEFDRWFASMFPTQARQTEQAVTGLHRGGKKKGDGSYDPFDEPLVEEMDLMLREGRAASVREAALTVLPKAKVRAKGNPESTITRLCRRYRKAYPRHAAIAP